MDYKSGEIYLGGRERELLSDAIITQIGRISAVKAECSELGLSGYDFDWTISNYRAILMRLGEE
jgi:hypothetical protein